MIDQIFLIFQHKPACKKINVANNMNQRTIRKKSSVPLRSCPQGPRIAEKLSRNFEYQDSPASTLQVKRRAAVFSSHDAYYRPNPPPVPASNQPPILEPKPPLCYCWKPAHLVPSRWLINPRRSENPFWHKIQAGPTCGNRLGLPCC